VDRWEIVVREGGPAVVLTVRGVVRAGFGLLHDHLADAVDELGDRPAVVDVSELWVQHPAALQVLRSLLGRRPPGSGTVVLARTSTRRRLHGVFDVDVAWYPAELRTPWLGVAAALAHRRYQLPAPDRTAPQADPLGELLWAAAQERTGQR
jgi:hypothetical protein